VSAYVFKPAVNQRCLVGQLNVYLETNSISKQARNQRRAIARLPPGNLKKQMHLLGIAIGYIILPPPKIAAGFGSVSKVMGCVVAVA